MSDEKPPPTKRDRAYLGLKWHILNTISFRQLLYDELYT